MSTAIAINTALFLHWQKDQEVHDHGFHKDISQLAAQERINHMALHFGKYAGRIARYGPDDLDNGQKTVIDAALIALSAANALLMNLQLQAHKTIVSLAKSDILVKLVEPVGRLQDAIEKMDHLDQTGPQMQVAVLDIFHWVIAAADYYQVDLDAAITARRAQIRASRHHIGVRAIA